MKSRIAIAVLFVVVFLLSFRSFLSFDSSVGHNWDWWLPSLDIFSEKLNASSIYTWSNRELGLGIDLSIAHLLPTSLFVFAGKLLGLKVLLFLLFFLVIFVSFISFKKLLDFLLGRSFLNYIPAFLYGYSPFLFNDIIGGSWVMWISYSFCPLYFIFILKYLRRDGVKYLLFSLLTSLFIVISLQHFVLINLLIAFYLLYEVIFIKNKEFKNIVGKLLAFLILMVLLNIYWILPFSYTFINFAHQVVLSDGGANAFDPIKNSSQSIWNIFNLGGYLDRNMYLYVMPLAVKSIFQSVIGFAWLLILGFFLKNKNKIYKPLFWLIALLILTLIIKGGNQPFPEFALWLYRSFPFMKLYRSPQHLMFIPSFIIPILIAFSLNYFYKELRKKKTVLIVFGLITALWISGWWYNGDLGHRALMDQGKDTIDFYRLPPELKEYYESSQKDETDYRSFFLPAVFSPKYLKTEYQNQAQGIQPEYLYLDKPTFTSEVNKFADAVEISFCKKSSFDYVKYLSLFSVKNIILRSDIYPHFTKSAGCWSDDFVKTKLDASASLEKFLSGEYASAYRVKDDYYLPHFYIPQHLIYLSGDVGGVSNIVSSDDWNTRSAIFLADRIADTDGVGKSSEELMKKTDEIFVKGELENKINEKWLGVNYSEVFFPYVRQSPKDLLYPLVLKREEYDKWKVRKYPEKLFEKHLFYANKRISEVALFGVYDSALSDYKKEMTNALEILKKLKQEENKDFVVLLAKYQGTLQGQREKLRDAGVFSPWEEVFEDLDKQAEKIKTKQDFSKLAYKVEIPKAGEYKIFLDENGSTISYGEKYFEKGAQDLVLSLSGISGNLIDRNLKIKDYLPDSIYKVSFNYQTFGRTNFFIRENEDKKIVKMSLFSTGGEFKQFEMFFKSSLSAINGFVSLSDMGNKSLEIDYDDITVQRILQPTLILKSVSAPLKIGKSMPKITFARINPVKYSVKIEDAEGPYFLVFNESFHKGWKIYNKNPLGKENKLLIAKLKKTAERVAGFIFNNKKNDVEVASYFNGDIKEGNHGDVLLDRYTFETWGEKSIADNRHYSVNGYANAWYIIPEDTGGSESYEIIVEFWPQRLFYIGTVVSIISFTGFCLYVLFFRKQKCAKLKKSE